MVSPWLIGAGLSAASQFIPRRRKTTLGRRPRRSRRTRLNKSQRSAYKKASLALRNRQTPSGMRSRARQYVNAIRTYTKNKKSSIQSNYSSDRSYLWRKDRLTRNGPQLKLLLSSCIERLQGVKQEQPNQDPSLNTYFPGYYIIGKGSSGGTANALDMPIYLFDLTRVKNVNTDTYSQCIKRLNLDDTALPQFFEQKMQLSTGTDSATSYWQIDNAQNQVYAANPASPYIQNMWYDIRLKLYGARKQPVTYDVMLVSFNRQYLIPETITEQAGTNAMNQSRYKHFWQELGRNCIVNTILPQTGSWASGVKVLRRQRVRINASSSIDLDANPSAVDVRWFVRDGKVRSYKEYNNVWTADTAVDNVGWVSTGDSYVSNNPSPTSRLYLIVRATDMTTISASDDMDDSPSFDACLRRKTIWYPQAGAPS